MSDRIVSFRGPVSCRRGAAPLGLTLVGETAEHPGEPAELAFSGAVPADFPEALEGALVERVAAHRYRIASAPREWLIEATAVHLHRDIAVPFYRAIPPRPVPSESVGRLEAAALLIGLSLVSLIVFGGFSLAGIEHLPIEFLCAPFLFWAAFRLGRRAIATCVLVMSVIAMITRDQSCSWPGMTENCWTRFSVSPVKV